MACHAFVSFLGKIKPFQGNELCPQAHENTAICDGGVRVHRRNRGLRVDITRILRRVLRMVESNERLDKPAEAGGEG